ncbi:MAG: AAA family ATPase, partial [Desulfovibrio sp.]|nr:AAA family ATPase [Desulfovibrio sp.]
MGCSHNSRHALSLEHTQKGVCSRFCIAALSGGGGKTFLSLGLARLAKQMGYTVLPFKKGPDYIDAAWLALAADLPCRHLDPFFMDPSALARFYWQHVSALDSAAQRCILLEGNRGLFDGMDSAGSCSTAEVAKAVNAPILLVIDCKKMTRTVAALVQGVCAFDRDLSFCGLILNNVGTSRQAQLLREVLSLYSDIPLLGIIPRLADNPMPERHMGLASTGDDFLA